MMLKPYPLTVHFAGDKFSMVNLVFSVRKKRADFV